MSTFFFEKYFFALGHPADPSESTGKSVQSTEKAVRPGPVRQESPFFSEKYFFLVLAIHPSVRPSVRRLPVRPSGIELAIA